MKRKLFMLTALVLALGLMQSSAFAEKGWSKGQYGDKKGSTKEMFFRKVKMIYKNQEELGMTDEQMDKIKALKIALKKECIRRKAEVDIIKVDLKYAMHEDEINIEAVNKLIDQKYEIKKAKAKEIVGSMAQLKKILTKSQMDKLKDIKKEKREAHKKYMKR